MHKKISIKGRRKEGRFRGGNEKCWILQTKAEEVKQNGPSKKKDRDKRLTLFEVKHQRHNDQQLECDE